MDVSIFLARVFGIYLIFAGMFYFFRWNQLRDVLSDYYSSPGLVVVTGVFTLILGLLIVVGHNVWELSWKLIITLFGYLIVFKGVIHMFFPEIGRDLSERFLAKNGFFFSGVLTISLGIVLLYQGYLS